MGPCRREVGITLVDKKKLEAEIYNCDSNYSPEIKVFDQVVSTSDWLRQYLKTRPKLESICVADQQTGGRGRNGRQWISPPGGNIYLSFSHNLRIELSELPPVSLVVGLALRSMLAELGVDAAIKWPNDILVNGQKLAGVLIDVVSTGESVVVVIGIGVNVKLSRQVVTGYGLMSTDLDAHGVAEIFSREALIAAIICRVREYFSLFMKLGFSGFVDEWNKFDAYHGNRVEIVENNEVIESGVVKGVDSSGMLILEVGSDERRIFSGDVSLRINFE